MTLMGNVITFFTLRGGMVDIYCLIENEGAGFADG